MYFDAGSPKRLTVRPLQLSSLTNVVLALRYPSGSTFRFWFERDKKGLLRRFGYPLLANNGIFMCVQMPLLCLRCLLCALPAKRRCSSTARTCLSNWSTTTSSTTATIATNTIPQRTLSADPTAPTCDTTRTARAGFSRCRAATLRVPSTACNFAPATS